MDPVPEVSVIIPVRDGESMIGACLDAIAAQRLDVPFEIIVVDDGSVDRTAQIVAAHPAAPTLVAQDPSGSYAARNAGLAAARGRVLAFTDADCVPGPGWLAGGLAAIGDGADLVGGAITPLRSEAPTVWERYDRALYLDQRRLVEEQGFAATANLIVRGSVLEEVGPFDPTLVSSGDLEWGRRATAAGHRIAYAPGAVVSHHPRRTGMATWRLHRRLGAGWAALARRGERPPAHRDPALRISLGEVVTRVAADGPPLRRRRLAPVHATAMAARLVGRLTGRPRHRLQSAARSRV
jgi:glycosyltransferase involved in cell wall biosynthesis